MNGEVRIWDARRPDAPLYEELVQPHGLMALAVHSGAPVMARCVVDSGPLPAELIMQYLCAGRALDATKAGHTRLLERGPAQNAIYHRYSVDAVYTQFDAAIRLHALGQQPSLPSRKSSSLALKVPTELTGRMKWLSRLEDSIRLVQSSYIGATHPKSR
jgi:hypothetical protein